MGCFQVVLMSQIKLPCTFREIKSVVVVLAELFVPSSPTPADRILLVIPALSSSLPAARLHQALGLGPGPLASRRKPPWGKAESCPPALPETALLALGCSSAGNLPGSGPGLRLLRSFWPQLLTQAPPTALRDRPGCGPNPPHQEDEKQNSPGKRSQGVEGGVRSKQRW